MFKELYTKYKKTKLYQYLKSPILNILISLTKNQPLKNIIIIGSHEDFDCNGGEIYEYLLKNKYNEKYKIVWILKHDVPKNMPKNVECYSIHNKSLKKSLRICFAKFFFADDAITKKVRDDQISVYCTHGGICFKDVRDKMDLSNLRLDYVLSPSKNYNPFVKIKYNLDLEKTKLLNFGYPSLDYFFIENINEYKKITNKKFNKYILWMPTFRRAEDDRNDSTEELPYGVPLFKTQEMFDKLNEKLKKENILLTIKIHPSQNPITYKDFYDLSNIIMITPEKEKKLKINKYNLMKNTDALISDYSGAAYEFLFLNKPLGFLISDIESYKIGFIVDNIEDYMPGNLIKNYEDFLIFIEDIITNNDKYKNEREELLNYLYDYKDGNSCQRLINFLKI